MTMRKKRYTPTPSVPPEVTPRLAAIVEVMAGIKTVSEAARSLGLSRNHFQTLLHRGVTGLVEAITPKAAGRQGKTAAMARLEAEVAKLTRENAKLRERAGSTDRLLEVASGLLQGRMRSTGRGNRSRKAKESPSEESGDSDPEPRRETLAGVEAMRRAGLTATLAASVAGVHPATVRRWRARARHELPFARHSRMHSPVSPETVTRVSEIVRTLHGLVGAESLSHSVPGLSRRQAARVKAATLTAMERERKLHLKRVTVTVPGVLRGMDAMHFHCAEGPLYALISADGAVPYRTSVKSGSSYDADLVATALATDIASNGAPLVYRLDRATAHDAPAARAVLDAHHVLVLHGPPYYPRFYGQLERQNREHRAWSETIKTLCRDEVGPCLEEMLEGVNGIWKRRTLSWKTATEAWNARPTLTIDRHVLREEVQERTARIERALECRGQPLDLAERLAIEQTLERRGYLRQELGGWC